MYHPPDAEHHDTERYPTVIELTRSLLNWIVLRRYVLLFVLGILFITTLPLFFITYPPNVDLPEHVLISKLLFEKLLGVSTLDMEISYFIAYRLIPIIFVSCLFIFHGLGISLLLFPKFIVILLAGMHTLMVSRITLGRGIARQSLGTIVIASCLTMPAAVSVYSAVWFIGFANFTLAIIFLIGSIFLTRRFVESGGLRNAISAFICLLLTYSAHPFAPMFWIMWCGASLISAGLFRSKKWIWFRIACLPVIFLPIAIYHLLALSGTEFEDAGTTFWDRPIFIEPGEWYNNRFLPFLSGELLKADGLASARSFALAAVVLLAIAIFLLFYYRLSEPLKRFAITTVIFIFGASIVHEKFFPIPAPHWLAYDYRFSSVAYAVCMTAVSYILIRILASDRDGLGARKWLVTAAVIALVGSTSHLFSVWAAYGRFEPKAEEYLTEIFSGRSGSKVYMPNSRWHPDGKLIRLYICLREKDCNPKGTTFESYGGSLYAVRLTSRKPGSDPLAHLESESTRQVPRNAFFAGPGTSEAQFSKPRGLAVDAFGNIYVADSGNGRIQIFDRNGTFIRSFGEAGEAAGQLKSPGGLVILEDGSIYVVESGRNKLMKFDPAGNFVKEWSGPTPEFFAPRDLAADQRGNLFIVDQGATRIVRFDIRSEQFSAWGAKGSGENQFHESTGIAAGDGLVYVADLGNDRVTIHTTDGSFVRQWPVPDWGRYPWHFPDVAYDSKTKTLYATNGWKNEILSVAENGTVSRFTGELSGKLDNPSALSIAQIGDRRRVFVLNTDGSNVVYFDLREAAKEP